jgi:hypothetical protein
LISTLKKNIEHTKVRHKPPHTQGGLGGGDIEEVLNVYRSGDKDEIVVESCEVALDAMNYWETQFSS